jgi:putative sugar O-methyltransferase
MIRFRGLALQYLNISRATQAFLYSCIGKSQLSKAQEESLQLLRKDNLASGSPFVATSLWQNISREFNHLLRIEGIGNVENQAYNNLFSQPDPTHPRNYRYALWMLYCQVKQIDKLNLLERLGSLPNYDLSNRSVSQSGVVIKFEGKSVTWDLLISIATLYSIAEIDNRIFTEPLVVADLGAGWGRILYFLKLINPKCTCIVFDLPEPLLISMNYFPKLLPEQEYFFYEDIKKMSSISADVLKEGSTWFCASQDLAKFEPKSIDIFINVASFQEMTKLQIQKYFALIDSKVKGLLYLQEYWKFPAYKDKFDLVAGYDDYPFLSHWQNLYTRNIFFSDLYFESVFNMSKQS